MIRLRNINGRRVLQLSLFLIGFNEMPVFCASLQDDMESEHSRIVQSADDDYRQCYLNKGEKNDRIASEEINLLRENLSRAIGINQNINRNIRELSKVREVLYSLSKQADNAVFRLRTALNDYELFESIFHDYTKSIQNTQNYIASVSNLPWYRFRSLDQSLVSVIKSNHRKMSLVYQVLGKVFKSLVVDRNRSVLASVVAIQNESRRAIIILDDAMSNIKKEAYSLDDLCSVGAKILEYPSSHDVGGFRGTFIETWLSGACDSKWKEDMEDSKEGYDSGRYEKSSSEDDEELADGCS